MVETSSSVRASIGRYELVGPLAVGGMAEVLLGRVRGPSGFERPVVIKRILPHLARELEFREMFLDEARIAVRIRHPNVVAVEELGEHADNLFLVMEYLEGESLSTLGKLQKKLGEGLPPHLGAFIVAEACAGLHAAHELKGTDGTPLGVVHRDISPQNVFVLYDGHIKVIDFGIAKAKTSESRTRTGQLKGKFSYMAPEQCLAHPLDRRSDIFALGVLLFELTTGKRLFERDNDLLVFRAVCEEPMPLPSQIVAGYPPRLEQICMRALARDRDERYATAADMRRDLKVALREIAPAEQPEEELAALMGRLFVERIGQKKAMLATLERGERVATVPPGEDSFRSEASRARKGSPALAAWQPSAGLLPYPVTSSADETLATKTNSSISSAGVRSSSTASRRKRWPLVAAVGAGLCVAAGVLTFALRTPKAATSAAPDAEPASAREVATATAAIPSVTVSPASTQASASASTPKASARPGTGGAPRTPTRATGQAAATGQQTTATAAKTGFRRFD